MALYLRGFTALAICVVASAATAALAHGPQIQIGVADNTIVTHALFSDEPYQAATLAQRVYEIPMVQRSLSDVNDGWYAQPNTAYAFTGPGIALLDGQFGVGSVLSLTFVDGLKWWNGSAFIDPGSEQLDAYRGATHTAGAATTDAAPFASYSFTAVSGGADEHKTAFWRLLGDGGSPNTPSEDGIYLLSLQLRSDQIGIAPSAPLYFLLNKNGMDADATAALSYVGTYLVPEPAPAPLMGIAAVAMLMHRRIRASEAER